ncbi:MAG: hypothetical protein HY667_01710, partial [Chloroflexi bacterium]|nr:hypothetical protein [Chloroflexota bacterium]
MDQDDGGLKLLFEKVPLGEKPWGEEVQMQVNSRKEATLTTPEVVRETFEVTSEDGVKVFAAEKYMPGIEIKGTVLCLHPMGGLAHMYWDLPLE